MTKKEFLVLLMIVIAMATRFIFIVDGTSLIPNFTAVGAIAIFGACYLKGAKKWVIPIVVLWISDMILNNIVYARYYDHFQVFGSPWVYGSIFVIGVLAYFILRNASWLKVGVTSILAAVLFFLITNFGFWAGSMSPYTKDISGLMDSYLAGVPFFRNALLGNLFFSFALFGSYEYLASKMSALDSIIYRQKLAG